MTLEELGAALRAKREERGLSLENVSERLKISTSHLDALEKGDLSGMPHTAYAKGFLRSYARYLGLPEDEYKPVLDSLSPDRSSVVTEPLFEPDVSARPHRDTRWIGIVLSLALACLIARVAFRSYRFCRQGERDRQYRASPHADEESSGWHCRGRPERQHVRKPGNRFR